MSKMKKLDEIAQGIAEVTKELMHEIFPRISYDFIAFPIIPPAFRRQVV